MITIQIANFEDLSDILALQKEAYLSEGRLVGDMSIPPLTQTLEALQKEHQEGTILKGTLDTGKIIASARFRSEDGTVFVGKLMVNPLWQGKGYGGRMIKAVESYSPAGRYELFTSSKSERNQYLYQKNGYAEFKRIHYASDWDLVYMEKIVRPPQTGLRQQEELFS